MPIHGSTTRAARRLFPLSSAAAILTLFPIRPLAAQSPGDIPTAGSGAPAVAAAKQPVEWAVAWEGPPPHAGEMGRLVAVASLSVGWHLYSTKQAAGGPVATNFTLSGPGTVSIAGAIQEPAAARISDPGFQVPVLEFKHSVAFGILVKIKAGAKPGDLRGLLRIRCQVCNDRFCLPPGTITVAYHTVIEAGPVRSAYQHALAGIPDQPAAAVSTVILPQPAPQAGTASTRRQDVGVQVHEAEERGLLAFVLLAVAFGLAALATPCVFPMIPITVSFFAKQHGSERSGLATAIAYCVGIVGTFTGVGLFAAALFGASGIQRFAANPWVNIGIAVIFLVLAASLMGYFELALPSGLVNRSSVISRRGGILGAILMGLTFTLTSFTCTMPFVGTLLASTAQGHWFWPAIGMMAFSTAFALPFFLLALFPRLIRSLPRSGGWLVIVKGFMGFIEIAAAIKFLSNADLVWQAHLLTRTAFLATWAVIFVLSGLYLLGLFRVGHGHAKNPGTTRKGVAALMIATGVYFGSAISGAPLGPLQPYAPPPGYEFGHSPSANGDWLLAYDMALGQARLQNRPVFVDFTGYTCTNCRWMEENIFTLPEVKNQLARFVRVELYTDGTNQASERNRDLEQKLFGTVALPLYAIVDPTGKPERAFAGLTRDQGEFLRWLEE